MKSFLKLPSDARFSNKDIITFMMPIFFEQILIASLTMANTFMIKKLPDSATTLAAIANVGPIDTLFKQVFVAFAAGGGVFISQFIGAGRPKDAGRAMKMSIYSMLGISLVITLVLEIIKAPLLNLLYPSVDAQVMKESLQYYSITIFAYPFMALFNCGTASFRAIGKSRVTFYSSIAMMSVNIGLKYVFLFIFGMGVIGAGLSLLIAYAVAGITLFVLLCSKKNNVRLENPFKLEWDWSLVKRIYTVATPSGIENGMFQLGPLLLQTLVASLGTAAINANYLVSTVSPMTHSMASAFQLGIIPFISQCMGAGKPDEAEFYTKHILKLGKLFSLGAAIVAISAAPFILTIFESDPAARWQSVYAAWIYFAATPFFYLTSFALPAALRGTGDTKFPMIAAICTMFAFRIGCAYLLVKVFNVGFIAVWIAMVSDWVVRSIIFTIRFRQGKWKKNVLIGD